MLNITLDIDIDEVEVDKQEIKNLVEYLFQDKDINLKVEYLDEIEFEPEEEEITIDLRGFNYGEKDEFYSISMEMENHSIGKSLEFDISEKGRLNQKNLQNKIYELFVLAKFSLVKEIFC